MRRPKIAYVDSSVLVKRYVMEAGSVEAAKVMGRHRVATAAVAGLEICSALVRRGADLEAQDLDDNLRALKEDEDRWLVVEGDAQPGGARAANDLGIAASLPRRYPCGLSDHTGTGIGNTSSARHGRQVSAEGGSRAGQGDAFGRRARRSPAMSVRWRGCVRGS